MSDLTAEQLETGRRNLLSQLRHDLKRDLSEYPVDADTMRDLVEVLEGLAPERCPTCNGREWINGQWVYSRETVGMVCQTCGHDYAAEPVGVSDEAVEAAAVATNEHRGTQHRCACGWRYSSADQHAMHRARAALEAAQPFMQPQVVASRQSVHQAIADELDGEGVVSYGLTPKLTDRVMDVARPLPTREQIAEALSNATRNLDYTHWETPNGMLPFADAVLALMGGAE